ncbi:hypothetical protein HU200_040232 [Digitaria exilis]|uniref:Uncharacterized protein n=1 Tax=Digitaria exilis TaxID=1010633 RepID=A0A835BA12_9POAL|nr:hypothetical protein HU200_040232 [Digitaria exilis]
MAATPDHSLGFFSAVCSRIRAASSAWRRSDAETTRLGQDHEATVRSRLARRAAAASRFGRNLAFFSFNLEKCEPVDDATSFSSESHLHLRDDAGGGDGSWGHSKDFQPMHSDGLQRRTFSIEKTHITDSSAFRQLINWSTEHLSDDPEDPNHMKGTTAEHHSNSGAHVVKDVVTFSTVQISSSLPGCSIAHTISNATDHAGFSSSVSCSNEGVENKSSMIHVSEDNSNMIPFLSDKELLVSSYAVQNIERHPGTSGLTLSSRGTEKEDVDGGFCFVKISPELSFLSSPGLAVESGKDVSKRESCKLDKKEENDVAVISEEEALPDLPLVTTAESNYVTSGFSLHAQDSNMMEVSAVINIFSVIPESNHPASVELLVENNEDSKDAETSDVHSPEQKGQGDFLDPLVNDSFKDSFATSEFLPHRAEAEMTEVLGVVKEGLSEGASNLDPLVTGSFEDSFASSEFLSCSAAADMTEVLGVVKEGLSEGSSNHQHDIVASSDDGDDTENAISASVSVQLIPEANITEALQDDQETLPDPLYRSSFCSGIFLSSSEISNDEAHSSNSNSHTLYANSVENEKSLASKGGGSGSKDEMNFAFPNTSILLNEVASAESWTDNAGCSQCIPESKRTQFHHDGKEALPRTSERANFGLEESLISLDQEINLEIFSLYSRSSSCVSEVNMTETLRSGTFPALENDNDFNFDEMTSIMVHTNNTRSADFIPEINMTETLNVDKEATVHLEPEVCSNFDISLKPPEVGNGVEKLDSSLDLRLWSFDPVVDASEGLPAAQGFSKLQSKNDFTFVKANVTTKEFNDDVVHVTDISGDLQNSKETPIDSSKKICSARVGSHFFSQNASPETQPWNPLMFKESLVDPYEVYVSDNISDNAELLMCSTEVNLIESLDGDQRGTYQQQEETNLISDSARTDHSRSFDPEDENPSSFEENSPSKNLLNNLMRAPDTRNKESVTFSVKGSSDPPLKDDDSFDKISGDEQANESLKENTIGFVQIDRTQAEVNCTKSQDFSEGSDHNCTEASESVNKEYFEPEHQGPEMVLSQVEMPLFVDESAEIEKYLGSSSTARLETVQVLPVSAVSEKGFLEGNELCEWRCTDKEPKDLKVGDMKDDVEDLIENHEVSQMPSDVALNFYLLY